MIIEPLDPQLEEGERRRRRRVLFRHRKIPVRLLVPNFFTLLSLCAGVTAIRMAIESRLELALALIVVAALLDGVDGRLARALKAQSRFGAELDSLAAVLPDFTIPASLHGAAATGISRPDALMQRFEAALPDILSARDGGGDWTQNAIDWAKSLLALRPAGEVEGTSPEAVVSRLEAAMDRRDYAAALALLAELPASMQAEAAPIAADITTHADADGLVADLRMRALASAETSP